MKYVLTFDIGIKNLAYCLMRYDNDNCIDKKCEKLEVKKLDIIHWGILDISHKSLLCKQVNSKKKECNESASFYLKNVLVKSINLKIDTNNDSNSKLTMNKEYKDVGYCRFHANVLKKEDKEMYDKLLKVNKSIIYKDSFNQQIERLLKALDIFYEDILNGPYHVEKVDDKYKYFEINNLEIYIENQPVLKNPIMKTISISLYTFFYLKKINNPRKIRNINFVSATVKTRLPFYNLLKKNVDIKTNINKVNDYKNRKIFSINLTNEIVEEKLSDSLFNISAKSNFLLSKKKDDMADTLIYGFYALLSF